MLFIRGGLSSLRSGCCTDGWYSTVIRPPLSAAQRDISSKIHLRAAPMPRVAEVVSESVWRGAEEGTLSAGGLRRGPAAAPTSPSRARSRPSSPVAAEEGDRRARG